MPQFFLALASLAFAFYMIPGLWGAPLKAVSAFAPPMNTQDFNLYKNEVHRASRTLKPEWQPHDSKASP